MTSIDELCKILKAYEEGKSVELLSRAFDSAFDEWKEIDVGEWLVSTLLRSNLRIKPEPREIWVVVYEDGSMHALSTKSRAEDWVAESEFKPKIVKFREVLEDE